MAAAAPTSQTVDRYADPEELLKSVRYLSLYALTKENVPVTVREPSGKKSSFLIQTDPKCELFHSCKGLELRVRRAGETLKHAHDPSLYKGRVLFSNGDKLTQKDVRVLRGNERYTFLIDIHGVCGCLSDQAHSKPLLTRPSYYSPNIFICRNSQTQEEPREWSQLFDQAYVYGAKSPSGTMQKLSRMNQITMKEGSTYLVSVRATDQAAAFSVNQKSDPSIEFSHGFIRVKPSKTAAGTELFTGYFMHTEKDEKAYVPIQVSQHNDGFILRSQGDPESEPIVYCSLSRGIGPTKFPEEIPPWQEAPSLGEQVEARKRTKRKPKKGKKFSLSDLRKA